MNFLAHLLLSGENRQIQAGNLFGDEVKGSDLSRFPKDVRIGITQHRFIDSYTDSHEINLEVKKSLYPYFSKYAGVVLDLYYDHFLAKNWNDYHTQSLEEYAQDVYLSLEPELVHFSETSSNMFSYMKKQNWLLKYSHKKGMNDTFIGMSHRLPVESGMKDALSVMEKHYSMLEIGFEEYFPNLINYARIKLLDLQSI